MHLADGARGVARVARRWVPGWRRPARAPDAEPSPPSPPAVALPTPAIFHVTHWKAGSQWLNKIINRCVGDRVVFAEQDTSQFLVRPLLPGRVYTTCYVTRPEFYSVSLPEPWHRFVVIRDLRDTLISLYFSMRFSHADSPRLADRRERLGALDFEEGLLCLMEDGELLGYCAAIQRTWAESGEELVRYEDLLAHDLEILESLLTQKCPLGVPVEQVREAVLACRFEALTRGRTRGQEDIRSHERKGVAGDWRNHFTDRVTRAFKARFGDLLVATGYERDLQW